MAIFQKCELFADALEEVERALQLPELDPTDRYDALLARGRLYYELERYEHALEDLTQVIEAPDATVEQRTRALVQRGLVYERLDDTTAALADYTTVIETPDVPQEVLAQAYFERGTLLGSIKASPESMDDIYAALFYNHNVPVEFRARALISRANARNQLGDLQGAVEEYERLAQMSDAPLELRAVALFSVGEAYVRLNQKHHALHAVERLIALKPATQSAASPLFWTLWAQAHFYRGVILQDLGRYREALDAYRQVTRLVQAPAELRQTAQQQYELLRALLD